MGKADHALKMVFIMSADASETREMCRLVQKDSYQVQSFTRVSDLIRHLKKTSCMAVILDVDSVPLDNRTIRELTVEFPAVCFFCTSCERFHPELKDAICYHIYACIRKPIDPDELLYWLKCIRENESDSKSSV